MEGAGQAGVACSGRREREVITGTCGVESPGGRGDGGRSSLFRGWERQLLWKGDSAVTFRQQRTVPWQWGFSLISVTYRLWLSDGV